ncbi:MAG: hypothetical protein K2X72_32460 [Reyranella sp.]|nr:hypothetical protein [Reyranella sp.]
MPAQNFTSRQAIGGFALAYRPNAGQGNTYAVASALDVGSFPAQFSDMDGIYNSLDALNFSSPSALQMALKQLGGEAYADYGYMRLTSARQFLDVIAPADARRPRAGTGRGGAAQPHGTRRGPS